ncbi:MAG: MmgE/PrpD family protein [Rhodospirillaceae bacterium]|jgi:2-methylcitrate dehydratase PrpD
MPLNQTQTLAKFAADLTFDQIPADIVERTKFCIIDTVAACTFGSELPWSKMIIKHATTTGRDGKSSIFGPEGYRVQPAMAALSNGALSHSFELDNLRMPSVGMHPGAIMVPSAMAMGQELGSSGKDIITAFTCGIEVLNRIGNACKQSCEELGFHAPGINGGFGGSITAGKLMGLDAEHLTNGLGIAGSLSSGLLEFAKSGTGGMVKRLHLGRAAESGIFAATLARDGFTGPNTVLEGTFGFINVYARDAKAEELTKELGERWDAQFIVFKRYSAHITSHTPIQGILDMKAEHGFTGDDVASIVIEGNEKIVSHHDIPEPTDVMLGQYSTQFCTALALFKDPLDPRNFSEESVNDPKIREVCRNTTLKELPQDRRFEYAYGSVLHVTLKDGRTISHDAPAFKGLPTGPFSLDDLREKYMKLAYRLGDKEAARLFDRLCDIEKIDDVSKIDFTGKS